MDKIYYKSKIPLNLTYDFRERQLNFKNDHIENISCSYNLQDDFLSQAMKSNTVLDIFLINESIKQGVVLNFDKLSLLLYDGHNQYLISRDAMISIKPHKNLLIRLKEQS